MEQHGLPEKITIDKSGANAAAIEALKEETSQEIVMRQIKYLNKHPRTGTHRAIVRPEQPCKASNSCK